MDTKSIEGRRETPLVVPRHKKPERQEYQREYMRRYYEGRKRRLDELKRDKACARCGFDDPRALDFHHRDPEEKSFKISEYAWKGSWDKLVAEIEKCDVLCANCHRIQHFEDGQYASLYD